MILNPAILALLCCSALVLGITAVASVAGATIFLAWDPADHSSQQLARERRVLLIESVLKVVLSCQIVSLLLFIVTVHRIHPLFTGAMCGAGTLNASRFGYPALYLKLLVFGFCGLWLVIHHASAAADGTAIVRIKQVLIFALLGALGAENFLQYRYFSDLDPEIITSCCATIFGSQAPGLGAGFAAMPVQASKLTYFGSLGVMIATGLRFLGRGRAASLFVLVAVLLGAVSVAAVITWIAPAYYELPTHHCPFCLLTPRVGYVGYPLFALLCIAVVAAAGIAVLRGLRALDPLRTIQPAIERKLCLLSMISFVLFSLIAAWPLVASNFRTGGF